MSKFSVLKVFISTVFIYSGQNVTIYAMYKQLDNQIIIPSKDIQYSDANESRAKNIIKIFTTDALKEQIKEAQLVKSQNRMMINIENEAYISIDLYLKLLQRELNKRTDNSND